MLKLSNETVEVLRNFASINPNLVVNVGSKFSTISEAKNIMATVTVPENFDRQFGVYDLNEFISVLNLLDDPTIDLTDEAAIIASTGASVRYRFANPSVLTTPQKEIKMPTAEVKITLKAETIAQVRKAASVLGHAIVAVQGAADGSISVAVLDPKDSSSNTFTLDLADKHDLGKEFSFQFLIENLKLVPGDYSVEISSKLISHWIHNSKQLSYYVALEKTSTI